MHGHTAQNFQMRHVTPLFLGDRGSQLQFARQQGNRIENPDGLTLPLGLNGWRMEV